MRQPNQPADHVLADQLIEQIREKKEQADYLVGCPINLKLQNN